MGAWSKTLYLRYTIGYDSIGSYALLALLSIVCGSVGLFALGFVVNFVKSRKARRLCIKNHRNSSRLLAALFNGSLDNRVHLKLR